MSALDITRSCAAAPISAPFSRKRISAPNPARSASPFHRDSVLPVNLDGRAAVFLECGVSTPLSHTRSFDLPSTCQPADEPSDLFSVNLAAPLRHSSTGSFVRRDGWQTAFGPSQGNTHHSPPFPSSFSVPPCLCLPAGARGQSCFLLFSPFATCLPRAKPKGHSPLHFQLQLDSHPMTVAAPRDSTQASSNRHKRGLEMPVTPFSSTQIAGLIATDSRGSISYAHSFFSRSRTNFSSGIAVIWGECGGRPAASRRAAAFPSRTRSQILAPSCATAAFLHHSPLTTHSISNRNRGGLNCCASR